MTKRGAELVGREGELKAIRGWWRETAEAGGRVVVVSGEAGIGKSALLRASLDAAFQDGLAVASSQCWEGGGSPPYWPWRELLPSIGVPLAGPLRPILETVHTSHDALLSPDPSSRLLLFSTVVQALVKRSVQTPLLLAIDDVHAADQASLELLRYVAPRMGEVVGLLVVTYRTNKADGAVEHVLADISKTSEALHISGLALEASTVLACELSAGSIPADTLDRIVTAAEGNPFFLRELVRWHQGQPGRSGFPGAVKASIRSRLQRLAPSARDVLAAAAVLGREFWVDDVVAMGTTESQVDVALSEGVAAGMLDERGGRKMRFAHALFAEVLLADLSPAIRSGLHAAAGLALEERLEGSRSTERLSELARHFLAAPRNLASTKGVRYGLLAAADAERRMAFEHAIQLYGQVRMAADGGDGQLEAEIGVGLGRCLWKLSRWDDARVEFRRAYAGAGRVGDVNLQARAALGFAGQHESGPLPREGIALLEAALALKGLPDPVVAALLARLAYAVSWTGNLDRTKELADAAVQLARRSGDERLLVFVLRGYGAVLCGPDDAEELLNVAQNLVARTTGRFPDQEIFAHGWEVSALIPLGRLAQAEVALRNFEVVAERLQEPLHLWCAAAWRSSLYAARGDFAAAHAVADKALASGGLPHLDRHYHTLQLLPVYLPCDRTAELVPDLQALASGRTEPVWTLAHALGLVEAGRSHAARVLLGRFLDDALPILVRDSYWVLAMALMGMLATTLDDHRAARLALEALSPYQDRLVTEEAGFMVLDVVAAILGDLSLLLGQPRAAEDYFTTGAEMARRNSMLPALGRCLLGRGRALLILGDSAAALQAVTEARGIATELGMPCLLRQCLAVQSTAKPSDDPFCALTASEKRVVALVAHGLTNPEIAKRLYLSPRTVQTHLYNVFAKLKVSTRSELAARIAAVHKDQPFGL